MTVELWYGNKPANAGEQQVLIDLYDFLRSQPEHFVIMSGFHAGRSSEIDLMVLKRSAFFIAEVKHVWGKKMVGKKEGDNWCYTRNDGTPVTFRNPYKQVRSSMAGWQDWFREHIAEIRPASTRDRDLKEPLQYIVVFPDVPADSEVDIGEHPVQVAGLSKFRTALVVRTIPGIEFADDDLRAIPPLLKLTQWHIEPPVVELPKKTLPLGQNDFQPPIVRMLVARGHDFSPPVFHLEKECILIGRDPDNDLVINHESVSRKHAEIRREGERWIVRDLHSQNGTFVSYNGDPRSERRIERHNALKNGSIVRFGHASYTVLFDNQ